MYAAIVFVENNRKTLSYKRKTVPLEFTTAEKLNCDLIDTEIIIQHKINR
jgi:hypothetical protein